MVEIEVLEELAGLEPGGADPGFAAVGSAGSDLALQAGGEDFLVGPARARSASRSTAAAMAGAT